MADKLGRNYVLEVGQADGTTLTVTLPFTIEFDITRNTLTSANVCSIRIYNLSLNHRNQIRYNQSNLGQPFRLIRLKAGYGQNLPFIFTGNISQAWSVREGVNFITTIECFDGGFAFGNGTTNIEFPAGETLQNVVENLAESLPFVSRGAIGSYPGTLTRGNSYSGNTADILKELTGGGMFIDQGKVHCLGDNEYIADNGNTLLINASSGLLGTPVLEQTIVHFDMIFEPNLEVGRRALLQSITEANFNGYYKITAVKHRGMISDAVCGDAVTTGEFFFSKILTPVVSP